MYVYQYIYGYVHMHIYISICTQTSLTFLPQNCAAAAVLILATMPQSTYNDLFLSRKKLQTIDKVSEEV